MLKQRSLFVTPLLLCVSVLVSAEESRPKIPSSTERIARARWQPLRQPVEEAINELPSPEPTTTDGDVGPYVDGEILNADDAYYDERYREGDYYGPPPVGGGCDGCGNCQSCRRGPYRPLFCLAIPRNGWVSAEYLMWWQKGMRLPPLVTTGPSTPGIDGDEEGRLGAPGTQILFGGNSNYVEDEQNGVRLRLGFFLDSCHRWSIEAEYFDLDTETDAFSATGNGAAGTLSLSRPLFDMQNNREGVELVSEPDVLRGTVGVSLASTLQGTSVHLRRLLCCGNGCADFPICYAPRAYCSRLEGLIGWRHMDLDESLVITEDLRTLAAFRGQPADSRFEIRDAFQTETQFDGFNFGILYQRRRGCWTLDLAGKFAIGVNQQSVTIQGQQTITPAGGGAVQNFNTGILALSTNDGTYNRDRIAVIPEFGATVGYNWYSNLRFTLGYTFIYWNNVVRPGDQVDLDVDTFNIEPLEVPPPGTFVSARPSFAFRETDYWVQGWSIGAEYRF